MAFAGSSQIWGRSGWSGSLPKNAISEPSGPKRIPGTPPGQLLPATENRRSMPRSDTCRRFFSTDFEGPVGSSSPSHVVTYRELRPTRRSADSGVEVCRALRPRRRRFCRTGDLAEPSPHAAQRWVEDRAGGPSPIRFTSFLVGDQRPGQGRMVLIATRFPEARFASYMSLSAMFTAASNCCGRFDGET